ncbi:transposable element Tcb1 transposase [Trichonephila clavipes]|uniref:Transposable element Tcb1 transposase n=1 Tax=Trichonephila clavipes TaxID=2585209 RepID=A0A8X6R6V6_TRICX|nr:transposable element Tcb1 transposase [Trichonephila clavipes]
MWSMVAQRLNQITPPASTPDQLWQRVEAAFGLMYPKNISKVSLNQCQGNCKEPLPAPGNRSNERRYREKDLATTEERRRGRRKNRGREKRRHGLTIKYYKEEEAKELLEVITAERLETEQQQKLEQQEQLSIEKLRLEIELSRNANQSAT